MLTAPSTPPCLRRILVVDSPVMRDSYHRCLVDGFALTHCDGVADAVAVVEQGIADGRPFAVAFVGTDLRETARRIRLADPEIAIVVVTAAADPAPLDIVGAVGPADKLFFLGAPLDPTAAADIAGALVARRESDRALLTARVRLAQLEMQGVELVANESRAQHIATHDPLTDAPNRLAFVRALGERAKRPGPFAVAMLDLDRFKLVNDTLGHLAGDALIREIFRMLQAAAPAGSLVARLGGDEFGLLFDARNEPAAVRVCERLIATVSTQVVVFGHSVQGGASAGVVVTEGGDGRDPLDALRRADLALNDAKRAGRGLVRLFDDGMDENVRFRRRIENGLADAIGSGELSLVYQPIVSRGSLAVEGFEALLRWDTVDHGPISPAVFIPIAEESNLIHELGDWVLATALAELKRWPGQYLSINFSPRQFRRHDFANHLSDTLRRAGIAPARVQVEITESAIFHDAERAAQTLRTLRQRGFRVALDDFGTGYSSLRNIRTFALDCLKIDRSFIDGMGRERESAAIVHSIIHLGRALGLGVIAEGVESAAQAQMLRIAGASHLQGFFFGRPVDAETARALTAQGTLDLEAEVAELALSAALV